MKHLIAGNFFRRARDPLFQPSPCNPAEPDEPPRSTAFPNPESDPGHLITRGAQLPLEASLLRVLGKPVVVAPDAQGEKLIRVDFLVELLLENGREESIMLQLLQKRARQILVVTALEPFFESGFQIL